jgi:hypothetical protein
VIWPGPATGYITLGNDLSPVADALETLWRIRETLMLLAAYGLITPASEPPRCPACGVTIRNQAPPAAAAGTTRPAPGMSAAARTARG